MALVGFARSLRLGVALLMAGAVVSACVFPEYNITSDAGSAGNGAVSSSAGNGAASSNAGTTGSMGGVPSVAGTTGAGTSNGGQPISGSSGSGSGGVGGSSTPMGGASPGAGAGGEATPSAGAGGETCGPTECPPSTCNNGMKDGTEAFVDCDDSAHLCGDCSFKIEKYVIGSGSGFSGSAIVTWDQNGMVFDFTVIDSTPRNDSSEPWNDDAVEVFLDLNDGKSSSYEGDDFQIIVPRDESAMNSPQAGANTSAMPVERSSNAQGYHVKVMVPWSSISAGGNAPLGKNIGFDLAVDDDSDGGDRDSQVVSFGTSNNFMSTAAFGTIRLN